MNWLLLGILGYLAIQMSIGLWVSRRVHNETDYILAGRTLGLGVASFSIFATWFGAESIQGAAGTMYSDGLSGASADPFGYVLCILLVGVVFARPLWNRGFTTFGDLFRARYSTGVERFVILLIVPTSVIWAAAQVRAFGNVVSHASGMSLDLAITTAALFVVLYTSVGGLLADAWTDLVQGIAIIVGLGLLVGVLMVSGDLQAAWRQVPAERLAILGDGTVPWYVVLEAWTVPVVGSMLISAILSTVDSCMLAGSTLLTHNVLLPIWPDLSERAKLQASRLGVLTMGVCAWALALRTESIKDLVETASAFGSAGVFVVACFALFTTVGGPLSAWAALCTGFLVWGAGALLEWPASYVTALVVSLMAYLATAPLSPGTALLRAASEAAPSDPVPAVLT